MTSPAFKNGGKLPEKYACDGGYISPPLEISGVPDSAKSLTLIMEDLDAYFGVYNHWVMWNIPPETLRIHENKAPEGAVFGVNSYGENDYHPPCPKIPQTHRYLFTVYALDSTLDLDISSGRKELEEEITNHIVEEGRLMVSYSRKQLFPELPNIFS